MSATMQHGRNRSRSPYDYSKSSFLSKVDKRDLLKLRVAIKRSGLGPDGPALPLERDIGDTKQISLLVHVRAIRCPPPRVPIFSGDIKVNQVFCEDRKVFTHGRDRRISASRYRSRSRSYNENRRSKSTDRYKRRSKERDRDRSRSRSRRKSKGSNRSRSRSRDRKRYREKSRSRSRSSRTRRPYESHEHKRRSVTPLRPGEYRPGHPDLALRKRREPSRSRSRSRSPKYSPSRERSMKYRSPTMPMPMMEYDFYGNYGQFGPINPMAPYRPVGYPPMYPHPPPMMMPRMPMPGYPRMPMFRNRFPLPVYNSRKIAPPTVTTTSQDVEKGSEGIVEQPSDKPSAASSMEISSSNQKCESDTGASDAVTE